MTLGQLLLYIGVAAAALAFLTQRLGKANNLALSFFQHFCGVLFIVSGFVKAIDPLGTAFKMEQYFAEFASVFGGTFLAGLFPALSKVSLGFSVAFIILEMVVGAMLVMGNRRKLTAWVFLLTVVFFTFLTGFTYLTGYVPEGVNFFSFGQWGAFKETNQKVTDCGCFGDFLKLKPFVSFLKDVGLLLPSLAFVLFSKQMHQLGTPTVRMATAAGTGLLSLLLGLSGTAWGLPMIDFRPFKEGTDVRAQKEREMDAMASVEILGYMMTNPATGETREAKYPDETGPLAEQGWEYSEQITSKPAIEATKISDFMFADADGNEVADEFLAQEGYRFMIVSWKMRHDVQYQNFTVQDTSFVADTIRSADTMYVEYKVASISPRETSVPVPTWNKTFADVFRNTINPFADAAQTAGYEVMAVVPYLDPALIDAFRHETQAAYPFYTADDILLKTIIRSNPGVLLWKDGVIVKKWHQSHLPSFAEVQAELLK